VWLSRGITAQLAAESTGDEAVAARASQLASRCFERTLALAPDDAHVHYAIGLWHYGLGAGSKDAADHFDRALALDPEHPSHGSTEHTAFKIGSVGAKRSRPTTRSRSTS